MTLETDTARFMTQDMSALPAQYYVLGYQSTRYATNPYGEHQLLRFCAWAGGHNDRWSNV